MGCLPLLHAFCCEPHKMYRYYKDRKARKLKKQVGDSSDSSDNARIVSEKTSRGQQRGDLRDHREHRDHRRRRSPSDTPADKRRKSPKTSSESHNTGTVASPRIVLTPPPRKRSLPPWPAPAVEIQQRYQTPPPPPAIPHAPNPTEPVPGPAPEPELEPSFAHTTLVVEPADPALPLVSAVAPALQIRHRPATAPPALVTHVSASIPRAPPQGQWPATVLEEGIFSPSQSTLQTQQTPVVTYQEAPSRGSVITPPEVFQYLMPESTIGPTDDDKRSNAAAADTSESTGLELVQDSHIIAEEPVYGQPTASTLSPQIDVEIYATPSGRRRERSVSRVRSEKNSRHRSKSRPDSSYSTNHREFRDSHHELRDSMFFLDGPRGDESDSSSMPAFSPLPTPDREQSVYIDQTRPRPDQLQARGHGSQPRSNPPLTRLIMGPMPKQSGIEIHRSQVDPNYDFASNLESLAREALREQAVWPTRRCSRRDRKEREDSERENSERENSSGRSDGERPRRSVSKGPPSTSVTRPTSSRRPKMPRRSSGNSRPGSYGSNQIHQITLPDSPRYTSVDIQIDLKKYQPKVLAKPGFSYEEVVKSPGRLCLRIILTLPGAFTQDQTRIP